MLYVVWVRQHAKGARWRKVGQTTDHAEAVAMIDSGADWWISVIRSANLAVALAQPSLFA